MQVAAAAEFESRPDRGEKIRDVLLGRHPLHALLSAFGNELLAHVRRISNNGVERGHENVFHAASAVIAAQRPGHTAERLVRVNVLRDFKEITPADARIVFFIAHVAGGEV